MNEEVERIMALGEESLKRHHPALYEEIKDEIHKKSDVCSQCGAEIQVMIFKGTGVCCELCRKQRDGDTQPWVYETRRSKNV